MKYENQYWTEIKEISKSVKKEINFIASYLPPKKRLFLGITIGIIFCFLTGVPWIPSLIFGYMIVEDALDCTVDVRACLLLMVSLSFSVETDVWIHLLYLLLFLSIFQSFHYVSGKDMPKEDLLGDKVSDKELCVCENEGFKDKPKDDSALIREEIIHLRNITPTFPLLPFLGGGIVLYALQPFMKMDVVNTFEHWDLLFGVMIVTGVFYWWDKRRRKYDESVGLERIYGFGDGDVLILAVWGIFFQAGVVFILWLALMLMIVAYVCVMGVGFVRGENR